MAGTVADKSTLAKKKKTRNRGGINAIAYVLSDRQIQVVTVQLQPPDSAAVDKFRPIKARSSKGMRSYNGM